MSDNTVLIIVIINSMSPLLPHKTHINKGTREKLALGFVHNCRTILGDSSLYTALPCYVSHSVIEEGQDVTRA